MSVTTIVEVVFKDTRYSCFSCHLWEKLRNKLEDYTSNKQCTNVAVAHADKGYSSKDVIIPSS